MSCYGSVIVVQLTVKWSMCTLMPLFAFHSIVYMCVKLVRKILLSLKKQSVSRSASQTSISGYSRSANTTAKNWHHRQPSWHTRM